MLIYISLFILCLIVLILTGISLYVLSILGKMKQEIVLIKNELRRMKGQIEPKRTMNVEKRKPVQKRKFT